jgi:hypothetical protein
MTTSLAILQFMALAAPLYVIAVRVGQIRDELRKK